MNSEPWLMRVANNKFRLNPVCHPVPVVDTNLTGVNLEFCCPEMFWELVVDWHSYDKASKTLPVSIIHFSAAPDAKRFKNQSFFNEVNHIQFTPTDLKRLKSMLKPDRNDILAELSVITPPSKNAISRYGFARRENLK
jgi:hypothetical protein